MDYRGVIFDFNGTLFFDNDKHVNAWGAISQLLRNKGITCLLYTLTLSRQVQINYIFHV